MGSKQVINLHIGQAGCQVGKHCWELFCAEHNIGVDGFRKTEPGEQEDNSYHCFFLETAAGQNVPRAIFIDTDPTTRDEVFKSKHGKLYHPEFVMGYKKDCKNNFFEGRAVASLFRVGEDVMDRVRIAADNCDNLQGFFVYHAFGGGTGTGVGCEVLHMIHEQFDRKHIFQPVIYPSHQFSSCIVEPYNCLFATHYTREIVDLSLMLDNEASYRMCQKNLLISNPDFEHVNRIVAQCISAITTSLRYECVLNATLSEIVTNLVPQPKYRYPVVSLAPVRHADHGGHDHFSTAEIVTELFEERNILCDCGQDLKRNRYLAAVILLRGKERCSGSDGMSTSKEMGSTLRSSAGGGELLPIQASHVKPALQALVDPRSSHRQRIRFVPWMEGSGFKVGVVGVPPSIPDGFMAASSRQGALLGNTTAVRQLFVRQYTKFLKLLYHKAYVWQFLEAKGEMDMFFEAREGVREIIDQYEELLRKCVEYENDNEGSGGVKLEGMTSMPTFNRAAADAP